MMRALMTLVLVGALSASAQVSVDSGPTKVTSSSSSDSSPSTPVGDGQSWSVVGPRTVAVGSNVVEGTVGFPGISAAYLRGVAPGINLGVRLGFTYGLENMVSTIAPGFKAQALLKWRLLDEGKISLGVTFEPGPFVTADRFSEARVGFSLPIGLRLGIAASSALNVAVLLELPMWVEFGRFGGFNFPILTGAGVEYFITSQFVGFFRARVGPTLRSYRLAELSLETSIGVGYRF